MCNAIKKKNCRLVLNVTLGDFFNDLPSNAVYLLPFFITNPHVLYTLSPIFGSEESIRLGDSEKSIRKPNAALLLLLPNRYLQTSKFQNMCVGTVCEGVEENWENSDCSSNPHQARLSSLVCLVRSRGLPVFVDSITYYSGPFYKETACLVYLKQRPMMFIS